LPYDLPLLDIFRTAKVRPGNENTKIKGVFSEKGFSGYLGGSRAVVEGRRTEEKKGRGSMGGRPCRTGAMGGLEPMAGGYKVKNKRKG